MRAAYRRGATQAAEDILDESPDPIRGVVLLVTHIVGSELDAIITIED